MKTGRRTEISHRRTRTTWGIAGILFLSTTMLGACASGSQKPAASAPDAARASTRDQTIQAPATPGPSIVDPGPDFGFIPNGAQTVQPGQFYIETAFESIQSEGHTVRDNLVPTLLRVGVAQGFELRAQMPVILQTRDATGVTTGHGPLLLGFKLRFNRGEIGFLSPSVGIEAGLLLPVASAGMDSGTIEPLLTFNADHFMSEATVLTWSAGVFGPIDETGDQFAQGYFAAALTHQVAARLQLFATGDFRAPASEADGDEIGRLGGGAYWRPTDRLVFFGGYFLGLTTSSPDTTLTLGLAFAF